VKGIFGGWWMGRGEGRGGEGGATGTPGRGLWSNLSS